MRKIHIGLIIAICFFSCNKKELKEAETPPLMYEPTEMALLMRQMYAVNKTAKMQIEAAKKVQVLPDEFLNIHTAELTDSTDRNSEFDSLAIKFIEFQKRTFGAYNDSTKVNFNRSINTCVACHETRCVGPIPKIKKLLIK